ncbi:MAG: outer membrane beta-barrel family protein [Ginsengibacter sp.]
MNAIVKKMLYSIFLFYLIIVRSTSIYAQQSVLIKIQNNAKEPLPSATIMISANTDSAKAIDVADGLGQARFVLKSNQLYKLTISATNYVSFDKSIFVKPGDSLFVLTAEANSKALKSIDITATRPTVRQEDDKTIVDPENLASSSTNAYEILEKTPGLFVDQDGNVYLSSTTPATIYINGREQKMSASDIATLLKNLPPNSIASIEILRTPSAKYDASGSGGIVNVVLKKGVKIGFTGSINAGGNQGNYGNRFIGVNLNNNNGKWSNYLNLQFNRRNNSERIVTNRIFATDSLLSQDAFSIYPTNNYYLGYGINLAASKKWELSYDGRLNYSDFINTTNNGSEISLIGTSDLLIGNNTDVINKGNSFNINQGASANYKLDSLGSEWKSDVSFNYAPNNTNQEFSTAFYAPQNFIRVGDGKISTDLTFVSLQSNLLYKFSKSFSVETGLKSTSVSFGNSTQYFTGSREGRIKDFNRTSNYDYKENINAFFLQSSKTLKGITFKAGARVENTNMNGRQFLPSDTSFSIHRTDVFPYIYVSRNLFKIAGYNLRAYLVYRRTISRPGYQLLNPSQRYVDQYLFETGNPALRPQFTQNYEANVSVDERPIVAIGFNDTEDIFTNVIYQADTSSAIAYRTYDNLGTNKEIYFRALGAVPPGGRYFGVAGVQFNRNLYRGLYQNSPLTYKRASWSLFTYQTLKITTTTQLQINGFVRFNGQLQFYDLSTFGALNFSVNQQLLNKKLTISSSINDIFHTNRNDFLLQQGSVNANGYRYADTRRVGLNFRYNFGFRKKDDASIFSEDSPEKSN